MESTKCKRDVILNKKSEIKTTIDDIRQLIETYGSNHDEKTVNTFKRIFKKEENLWCNEEDDIIEDLSNCIGSLNNLKSKYFGEYQSNEFDSNTFTESPDWIKNKKSTINPQDKDSKCFQYSIILSLYHKAIKNNPERIEKSKPFMNNLNWENINFPPKEEDFKTFEMSNKSIALNFLQVNEQKISHFYKFEFNQTRQKK